MECLRNNFVPGVLLHDRYETISPLNQGSFGMVFVAKDRLTGHNVALKCITKPTASLDLDSPIKIDDQSEEFTLHSRLGKHINVVNLLDSFETEHHAYLVLEYCSMGDLYEAIRTEKGPRETEHVRSFMLQLVDAVEHLHTMGIHHRDIKPENIFLTEDGAMKLGDFGLATADVWSYDIAVGSDRYMAPEQYDPQGQGLSPAKADIWSVGICLLNVLFSRNPFGEPALSDPLFADYARDRQSLFDVFPNLSQDAFEVLTHCLAIDPEKRSLASMRESLLRVVSFTTDDESLDDFCNTENRGDLVVTTTDRMPLRTPSIASPPVENGGAFPWAQALHLTSPRKAPATTLVTTKRLSFTDELFPGADGLTSGAVAVPDRTSKGDSSSIESYVDSGLGLSIGSSTLAESDSPITPSTRSKPVPIAGSMPTLSRASQALSSLFGGKKKQFESKSWSDMFEEDEEEQLAASAQDMTTRPVPSLVAARALSQADTESDGRSTPRAIPIAMAKSDPEEQQRTPSHHSLQHRDNGVSQHTGFVFEEHEQMPRYSPPSKRSLIDKWAALGDRRRGGAAATPSTRPAAELPVASAPSTTKTATTTTTNVDAAWRRFRSNTWRRNMGFGRNQGVGRWNNNNNNTNSGYNNGNATSVANNPRTIKEHGIWQKKEWNISTDWRRSDQHLAKFSPLRLHESQLDGATAAVVRPATSKSHGDVLGPLGRDMYNGFDDNIVIFDSGRDSFASSRSDDEALFGPEWVGGWKDLHL